MDQYTDYTTWPSENPLVDNVDYPDVTHVNTLRNMANIAPSDNMLSNSILRTNTSSWVLNTSASRDLGVGGYPVGAASITDSDAADSYVGYQTLTVANEATLNPGNQMVFSAFVRSSDGGNTVFLSILNGNTGPEIASTITYHPGDGNWHRIYSIFTVPTGCTSLTFYLKKAATANATYGTGFQVESGFIPTGFRERAMNDGRAITMNVPKLASGNQVSQWSNSALYVNGGGPVLSTYYPVVLTNAPSGYTFSNVQYLANSYSLASAGAIGGNPQYTTTSAYYYYEASAIGYAGVNFLLTTIGN